MSTDQGEAALAAGPPTQPEGVRELLKAELAAPVFGLPFFGTMLTSRFETYCSGAGPEVPQVLLHLAGGAVLDVCHVVELTPRWIAMAVFRDDRTCEQMDLDFVPYELILRVTLSSRPAEERPLGFNVRRSQAALQAASQPQRSPHDGAS